MQNHINVLFSIFSQFINEDSFNFEGKSFGNGEIAQNLLSQLMQADDFILSNGSSTGENPMLKNFEELYSQLYSSLQNSANTQNAYQNGMMNGMFFPNMISQNTQGSQTAQGAQWTQGTQGNRGHRRGRGGFGQFSGGFPQAQWGNKTETPQNKHENNFEVNNWEIYIQEPDTPVNNDVPANNDTPVETPEIVDKPVQEPTNTGNNSSASKFNINETIEFSQQGYIGDCWLLSGLNSLSYTSKGQQLIKDIVTANNDGSYTVSFAGVNRNVNITADDLQAARDSGLYSTGDDDVLLMELAFEQIINDIQNGKIQIHGDTTNLSFMYEEEGEISSLDGGWLSDMIYLLTGKESEFITNKSSFISFLDDMEENPDDYVAKLSFPSYAEGETDNYNTITDIYGNPIYELGSGGHAFAIKSVSDGIVTIVNPHDSSEEYQISYEELIYSARNIEYYKL